MSGPSSPASIYHVEVSILRNVALMCLLTAGVNTVATIGSAYVNSHNCPYDESYAYQEEYDEAYDDMFAKTDYGSEYIMSEETCLIASCYQHHEFYTYQEEIANDYHEVIKHQEHAISTINCH